MADGNIPAGWYPDPAGDASKIRYWDGENWTEQTQNAQGSGMQDNYNVPITPQPIYAQGQQNPMYAGGAPVTKDRKGFAIAGLVLGIVSIPCGCCAYFAFVPAVLALIFGILGLKSSAKGMAIAAIILGAVGIAFGVVMTVVGADMVANPENYGLPADYYENLFGTEF